MDGELATEVLKRKIRSSLLKTSRADLASIFWMKEDKVTSMYAGRDYLRAFCTPRLLEINGENERKKMGQWRESPLFEAQWSVIRPEEHWSGLARLYLWLWRGPSGRNHFSIKRKAERCTMSNYFALYCRDPLTRSEHDGPREWPIALRCPWFFMPRSCSRAVAFAIKQN